MKSFLSVLQVKRTRVENIVKRYNKETTMPYESRGGDHISHKFENKKNAVISFISSLKCGESHYCRSQTERKYLPSELNIRILLKMYNASVEGNDSIDESRQVVSLKVKEGYFRRIFNRHFNLGFGNPRVDVCSTCTELNEQIKVEKDANKLMDLKAKRQIHKKRAGAFFELLREEDPEIKILSFDCQKNLALPKIPDQEAYYRRQLYLYNFSVVVGNSHSPLNKETCTSYVWTENTHKKGSNEIASCVYHSLNTVDLSCKTKVKLFADGCGGQNKNRTMLGMCCSWLVTDAPADIQEIEIVFPIRGHSFIPPDRLFAISEKKFKE